MLPVMWVRNFMLPAPYRQKEDKIDIEQCSIKIICAVQKWPPFVNMQTHTLIWYSPLVTGAI